MPPGRGAGGDRGDSGGTNRLGGRPQSSSFVKIDGIEAKDTASMTVQITSEDEDEEQRQQQPKLSKRKRRAQGSNPSTTWQQQPRIKSAGARARAYVSYAGLADDDDGTKKKTAPTKKDGSGDGAKRSADLLNPKLDLHSPEVKFGRLLGGTDQRSRHAAVKTLRQYLRERSDISSGAGFSELDLLKLWKGLWYTLYMADQVPVQDKLSKTLAELMWCLAGTEEQDEYAGQVYLRMEEGDESGDDGDDDDNGLNEESLYEDEDGDTMEIIQMEDSDVEESAHDGVDGDDDEEHDKYEEQRIRDMNETHCRGAHLVSLFLSTFLCTVRREWGNVDKHRVDKFYTAVRFMVSEAYKYMSKRHWNLGIIRLFNDVIYNEGLSADTPGLTNGLRYHLIDISIDELAKVNKDSERPLTEATFLDCLEPFFGLAQHAVDKNVQKRVMDNVLLKFLNEYSFVSTLATTEDTDGEIGDAKLFIMSDVHVGTVSKFIFQIASENETDERFRKSLYEMHKTFVRQIRAAGRDVDLDRYIDNEEDGAEEEEEKEATSSGKSVSVSQDGEDNAEKELNAMQHTSTKEDVSDDITSSVQKFATESKKKQKKKKKRGASEAPRTPKTSPEGDIPNVTTPSPSTKGKISVSDRAEASQKNSGGAQTTLEDPEKQISNVRGMAKKESRKKKRKKDSKANGEGSSSKGAQVDAKTPTPKKKLKQKSPPSVDPRSMQSPDQVTSPTSSSDEASSSKIDFSGSKRVSFGKMNHCKSHKASMRAVKTLEKERWDTAIRTPEKGILRPKGDGDCILSEKKKCKPSLGPSSSRKKKRRKQV